MHKPLGVRSREPSRNVSDESEQVAVGYGALRLAKRATCKRHRVPAIRDAVGDYWHDVGVVHRGLHGHLPLEPLKSFFVAHLEHLDGMDIAGVPVGPTQDTREAAVAERLLVDPVELL